MISQRKDSTYDVRRLGSAGAADLATDCCLWSFAWVGREARVGGCCCWPTRASAAPLLAKCVGSRLKSPGPWCGAPGAGAILAGRLPVSTLFASLLVVVGTGLLVSWLGSVGVRWTGTVGVRWTVGAAGAATDPSAAASREPWGLLIRVSNARSN